jgi:hypothetical protein
MYCSSASQPDLHRPPARMQVALDFLCGRREHLRRHPRGHDKRPGGHETKAIASLRLLELTNPATPLSHTLRGARYWQQFKNVGSVLGSEIAAFMDSLGLADAHNRRGLRECLWERRQDTQLGGKARWQW